MTLFIISIISILGLSYMLMKQSKENYPYQPDEINGTSIEIVVGFYAIIFFATIYVIYFVTPIEYKPLVKQYIGYLLTLLALLFVVLMGSSRSNKDYH